MPEPLTLAAVAGAVLTEGIKFLYDQAGEALKRWRERRMAALQMQDDTIPTQVTLPETVFEGRLAPLELHLNVLDQDLEECLRHLRGAITDYAEGSKPIDPNDPQLLKTVDALRQVMEAIYQQRLTFKGEPRDVSEPMVEGEINVKELGSYAYAAAIRAQHFTKGRLNGKSKIDFAHQGATVIGVDIKN